jgi:hypothetical protein
MRALTFLRQPRHRKRLAIEALRELLVAWWLVRRRAFRSVAPLLGAAHPGEHLEVARYDARLLADVRWAVSAVDRTCGGRFTCLMQGMAAKAMLTRRGVSNTLVLGAKLNRGETSADAGAMAAHAWLRVGPVIVLGGEARAEFVPVTSYHTSIGKAP